MSHQEEPLLCQSALAHGGALAYGFIALQDMPNAEIICILLLFASKV